MKTHHFFLLLFSTILWFCHPKKVEKESKIMTVTGYIDAEDLGITLSHEHAMVDFTGAEKVPQPQYDHDTALDTLLPYFSAVKALGVQSIFECTPKYIGRDVKLLESLSRQTGLNIITNTGYYAAADKKFLPAHAYTESASELATRWIAEWKDGIEGTGIRPGFIKLGVGRDTLDEVERKIVTAGAMTHMATGLKVAIHTGGAHAAFGEIEIFREQGVDLKALIVVHAQNLSIEDQVRVAKKGAWVSLDGVNEGEESINQYIRSLSKLKQENLLQHILISQDAYWDVSKNGAGKIIFKRMGSPYNAIMTNLVEKLNEAGFTDSDLKMLYEINPSKAFSIGVCAL